MFPKIHVTNDKYTDYNFVMEVLNELHVLFVHGSGFCPTYGKDHFRLVFLPPIDTVLEPAMEKLGTFMEKRFGKQ